jgi:AcrR family transcriptional regulator
LASPTRKRPAAKAGQRERLVEAMTQVAARCGYGDASVARVIEQAGVSRATFYEHFEDKEACFLAALEAAARQLAEAMAAMRSDPPVLGASQFFDDVLEGMASAPAATRILVVEAFAAGPKVRAVHDQVLMGIEATLEPWLRVPEEGVQAAITARAAMEGVGGILLRRTFRGETAQLGELRDDILAWLESYAAPAEAPRLDLEDWRQLGAGLVKPVVRSAPPEEAQRKLPRGKGAAAAETVAGEQRERILTTVAQLTRTKGYAAMTVADIVKGASVTREAFYGMFRSKQDAFLATQIFGLERAISLAAAGFFPGGSWPARVWGGLEALFDHIVDQPDLVYLDMIETYAAGPEAIRRSFDNRSAYHLFLEEGYRQNAEAEALPRLCSEAIGSAILGLIRWEVGQGRTERILEVLPQAVYVALAPFIGPAAAIQLVEAKVADATGGDAA